ncbi:bifunctional tRNA (adenosine(37)-N6)-threonylcarbamoyltransferase complex ATPase subunit type 1 TsaE/phosphotransferase [soil metagenome]
MNSAPNSATTFLADEAQTLALGAVFAAALSPGLHLYLDGGLGAGKTTFVRGLLRALGHAGRVRSPTYALCEGYELQPPVAGIEFERIAKIYLYHFDFYRINPGDDWLDAGFREAFEGDAVCLVEWPGNAGASLPAPDLRIALAYRDDDSADGRTVSVHSLTAAGQRCLDHVLLDRSIPWSLPAA